MNASRNTRILVVDDEPDIVQAYVDFLELPEARAKRSSRGAPSSQGAETGSAPRFEIHKAFSGEEAVELVRREKAAGRDFAGAFFDVKMPGKLDGLQAIQEIWNIDPRIPCTVVTAYHDRSVDDIDAMFGEAFNDQWDYLNKPFMMAEITQKARQMVASWNRKRQLEQARESLIRAERLAAVGQVSRAIGHEFGNILQAIVGKADLALNDPDPERVAERLTQILQAAEKASLIVRNLQSFSRPETSRGRVDLGAVIQGTLSLVGHEIKKSSVAVVTRLEAAAPVEAVKSEIEQVLLNLIINALHAMPGGGSLEIGCRNEAGKGILWVKDSGTGIPPEVMPSIFEYAFTTKGDKGSGLGLAISREILERHGGSIGAASEPGRGACFTLALPEAK